MRHIIILVVAALLSGCVTTSMSAEQKRAAMLKQEVRLYVIDQCNRTTARLIQEDPGHWLFGYELADIHYYMRRGYHGQRVRASENELISIIVRQVYDEPDPAKRGEVYMASLDLCEAKMVEDLAK